MTPIFTNKGIIISVNKFLYESIPDLFPEGYLTDYEIQLWDKFEKSIKDG